MLSFTHQPKNGRGSIDGLDFQPLVISNQPARVEPYRPPTGKVITKTHTNSFSATRTKQMGQTAKSRSKEQPPPMVDSQNWRDGGKIQIFDRKIRKNQLAEEERRLRAEAKKTKIDAFTELAQNEREIRGKTMKLELQQQKEIDNLKKLIQKDREEKEKNDRVYQVKLKEIEKERNELMKLERKIQQNGVKNQREFKKEMNVLVKNEYPSNDRTKCHQEIRSPQQPQQLTLSETNYQRNEARLKQIELLTAQREKCLQSRPTLNYNPTIIPLLSRASYKIISTHISTLVQLFVDDLLEEQVYLLEALELQQKMEKEKNREKDMIRDYYHELAGFVDEAEEIQSRVGRYKTMKFEDMYIPKNYSKHQNHPQTTLYEQRKCLLTGLQPQNMEQIQQKKDRFARLTSNFQQYKKEYTSMFDRVTEEIIDEALAKMAVELDRGSGDFVEVMFRREFE